MSKQDLILEFVCNPHNRKLLAGTYENYRKFGAIRGNVQIVSQDIKEKLHLSGLFNKQYVGKDTFLISCSKFQEALDNSKFRGITVFDLLRQFSGPLESKRDQREREEMARIQFFFDRLSKPEDCRLQLLLDAIIAKDKRVDVFNVNYYALARGNAKAGVRMAFTRVAKALTLLPATPMKLPVFASHVCGDPHSFDSGTPEYSLFVGALAFLNHVTDDDLSKAEYQVSVLWSAKIYPDDILNQCSSYGLRLVNGAASVWNAATLNKAVYIAPLRDLARMPPGAVFANKEVYVIENSGVFSAVTDYFTDNEVAELPGIICSNGQFRVATWILLTRLAESGAKIYYSGDFDIVGLTIAQKVLLRFSGAELWFMGTEDYIKARSSIAVTKPNDYEAITHPSLIPLAEAVLKNGVIGQQEYLLNDMVAYLQELYL